MSARSYLQYVRNPDIPIGHLPYAYRMQIVRSRFNAWMHNLYRLPSLTLEKLS